MSPEMTVVYAKIRDDVLRERWEHATADGGLRLGNEHIPQLVSVGSLEDMNELELECIRGNLVATRTGRSLLQTTQDAMHVGRDRLLHLYALRHDAEVPSRIRGDGAGLTLPG